MAALNAPVLGAGKEQALDPMNSADRKVIHDALIEVEGISTLSEGEDPRRYLTTTRRFIGRNEHVTGIEIVTPRHESCAAHMAGTYARLTGKLGVCMASLTAPLLW